MPLLARAAGGRTLHAWAMAPEAWERLKAGYREEGLAAPCCGRAVVPVRSSTGWQFFRHAPGEVCGAGESPEHIVAKTLVARAAAALGFAVTTEARGDGWVADVLVEAPRWQVAVEVQLSRLPLDAIAARQERYAADGIRGAWLVGFGIAGYEADPALPLFRLLTGGARPEVTPMPSGGRIGLERFTTALLSGGVRFAAAPAESHLRTLRTDCWRCRRDVTVPVAFGNVAGHPVLAPGGVLPAGDLGKVPELLATYRAALPALLRRRSDLAVLRPSRREAAGWVAHCPECDSAIALHRLRADARAVEACRLDGEPWPPGAPVRSGWVWDE